MLKPIDKGSWKLLASKLDEELKCANGERHCNLVKYGDEINSIINRFVVKYLLKKNMSTVILSNQMSLTDHVLRAFLENGKLNLNRLLIQLGKRHYLRLYFSISIKDSIYFSFN